MLVIHYSLLRKLWENVYRGAVGEKNLEYRLSRANSKAVTMWQ